MYKEFTPVGRVQETRANMKEFKARHTENDLLKALAETLDRAGKRCLGLEDFTNRILSCDVEAWYLTDGESRFYVKMDVANIMGYFEISFFTSMDLEINTHKNLVTVNYYKRECNLAD